MTSNNSLTKPWQASLPWLAALGTLIGFADALYLTIEHFQHAIPPCAIGSCQTVLTSVYATIGPVPISAIGIGYYLVAALCVLLFLQTHSVRWVSYFTMIVSAGFLVTLGLVSIQLFILHAICQYCMLSAATTTFLFIIALLWHRSVRQHVLPEYVHNEKPYDHLS